MLRYVLLTKFATESGYTEAACRTKTKDGTWPQGKVWTKAPDGRVIIDIEGYYNWIEKAQNTQASAQPARRQYRSPSRIKANIVESASSSSPRPLI